MASDGITIEVPGLPAPGGSKRVFVRNGKPIVTDDAKRNGDWKSVVACAARQQYDGEPLAGPVSVRVVFKMPRPKGHYGTGRNADKLKPSAPTYHTQKPDATKLWRSTEDALSGLLWKDDAVIVSQLVDKCWTTGQAGARITIETY